MSRPRFLADNDLNDAIVRGVARREPAVEFTRLRELGLERRPDRDVLTFAAHERWIVVSHDVNSMIAAALNCLRQANLCTAYCSCISENRLARRLTAWS